jgi:hypothetical protein
MKNNKIKKNNCKEKIPLYISIFLFIIVLIIIILSSSNLNLEIKTKFYDKIEKNNLEIGKIEIYNNGILPKKVKINNYVLCKNKSKSDNYSYFNYYYSPSFVIDNYEYYSLEYYTIEKKSNKNISIKIPQNLYFDIKNNSVIYLIELDEKIDYWYNFNCELEKLNKKNIIKTIKIEK